MQLKAYHDCLALIAHLGSQKVALSGDTTYNASLASYFALQETALHPACIVKPTTAEDVSTAVRVFAASGGHFAIRSGGHGIYAGAANIDGSGVTIDLTDMSSVKLSRNRKTAHIGPGASWGKVYETLDPLGVSVAGGRVAQVGVGGLATGGGISYFSPRYGWTCGTVVNYQVVLADGSIVNANRHENSDLLRALRGGSNNLGIVTRLDLNAFPQGDFWGGVTYYSIDTGEAHLRAFESFNSAENYDEYASLITTFGYSGAQKSEFVGNNLVYTKPIPNPPVYSKFLEIPSLGNSQRISNMSDFAKEEGSTVTLGHRYLFIGISHGSTFPMLNATLQRFRESVPAIRGVADIVWAFSLEPMPPAIYQKNLFNSLGFDNATKPLVINVLAVAWTNEADDALVEATSRKMFADLEADAKRLGEDSRFVYLNYAAPWQTVIPNYGSESVKRLQAVRERVDPNRVFTNQVPSKFKIPL